MGVRRTQQQTRRRLAAIAGRDAVAPAPRLVRTPVAGEKLDVILGQQRPQTRLDRVERGGVEASLSDPRLVARHHEDESAVAQASQRGRGAVGKDDARRVDVVGRVLHERAVEKDRRLHGHEVARMGCTGRSFMEPCPLLLSRGLGAMREALSKCRRRYLRYFVR